MADDCACLYGDDDNDSAEFFVSGWVKARKTHECVECRRMIQPGERYERCVGKWDGEMSTFYTCANCQDIRASLYCSGYLFGALWEDVREQLFPHFTVACVDKLTTPEAKRALQQAYQEWVLA